MARKRRTCATFAGVPHDNIITTIGGAEKCATCGTTTKPAPNQTAVAVPAKPPTRADGLREGRRRRNEAIDAVDTSVGAQWRAHADEAIITAAANHPRITSDDVWEVLDARAIPRPPEPRAMGPRMLAAAKAGIIRATPFFQPSTRPELHASPRRLYDSLTYTKPVETIGAPNL